MDETEATMRVELGAADARIVRAALRSLNEGDAYPEAERAGELVQRFEEPVCDRALPHPLTEQCHRACVEAAEAEQEQAEAYRERNEARARLMAETVPMTKAEARREFAGLDTWDVTNHYIEIEDHPCYGTQRREITKVNTASFGWMLNGRDERLAFSRFDFRQTWDGKVLVFGHPTEGDLFLTMAPAF